MEQFDAVLLAVTQESNYFDIDERHALQIQGNRLIAFHWS